MALDILSRALKNKKARESAVQTVIEIAQQALPIVRTVQAGQGILKVGDMVNTVNFVADGLNDLIPKASKMAENFDQFIPAMQIMVKSVCDSAKIFTNFSVMATSVGIGGNVIVTYQGIQVLQLIEARLKDISTSLAAQTALIAQKDFPQYVYDMIRERLGQTANDPDRDHWFFLYHPDNDWYPKFYHFLEDSPLGPRFCGYTNQIDTVFVFMMAARRRIREKELRAQKKGQPIRPVKIHLLIPAYQPILILEAFKIPEEIGDFIMEGRINSNKEFVWLNLPEEQRRYVVDIGNWVPPTPKWWDYAMAKVGLAEHPPILGERRAFGTRQQQKLLEYDDGHVSEDNGDDNGGNDASEAGNNKEEEKDPDQSTPLQHRRRRRHTKRRDSGEDRESRRGSESNRSSSYR